MREPILLRVEWLDCVLPDNRWEMPDEMVTAGSPIISVGFKVKEENGFLYLAATWQGDDAHKPFAQTIVIPLRAIVKKRRL